MQKKHRGLIGGVNQDVSPAQFPEGVTRFLLNTVNESIEGDRKALSTERGNAVHGDALEAGVWLIGEIALADDYHILFTTSNTSNTATAPAGTSHTIYLQDPDGTLTTLVSCSCLNFSTWHPIKGTHRTREGCQRTIYWIDPNSNFTIRNPPRIMDIDNVLAGASEYLSTGTGCTVAGAPAGQYFDCEKLRWFRNIQVPNIALSSILQGAGSLSPGTYQFFLQYTDNDENGTAFVAMSNPIPITTGQGSYQNIEGGISDLYSDQLKAIELNLTNLDTRYPYYRIAVFESNAGTGQTSEVFLSPLQPLTGTQDTFVYGGGFANGYTQITREAVLVPSLSYDFLDLVQMDGRIFIGNLKERNIPHADFQRAALDITAQYVTVQQEVNLNTGPKGAEHYAKYRSFMRDEVYEFAIVWVMNDGYETPPYPLVPRAANQYSSSLPITPATESNKDAPIAVPIPISVGTEVIVTSNVPDSFGNQFNPHNRPPVGDPLVSQGGWDDALYAAFTDPRTDSSVLTGYYTAAGDTMPINKRLAFSLDCYHLANASRAVPTAPNGYSFYKRWEIYNTAIQTQAPNNSTTYYTKGEFGYFESDETYPTSVDCFGVPVWGSLAGQNIRLFKFPDTTLEPHHGYSSNGSTIIPIGVEFSNINPPAAFASQVQGYKILVTKRDRLNRTIIDKGLFYHNWFFRNKDADPGQANDRFQTQGSSQGGWRERTKVPIQVTGGRRSTTYSGDNVVVLSTTTPSTVEVPDAQHSYSLNFHGPLYKFSSEVNPAGYVKMERNLRSMQQDQSLFTFEDQIAADGELDVRQTTSYSPGTIPTNRYIDGAISRDIFVTNRSIENQAYALAGDGVQEGQLNAPLINSTNQEAYIVELYGPNQQILGSTFNSASGLSLAPVPYLSPESSLYGNVFVDTKSYKGGPNNAFDGVDNAVCLDWYGSLKQLNYGIYGAFGNMVFIPTDNILHTGTSCTIFGGDCFISQLTFRKTSNMGDPGESQSGDLDDKHTERHSITVFVESTINTELRHAGDITKGTDDSCDSSTGKTERYAPVWYNRGLNNIYRTDDQGSWLLLDYCHHNYYAYNVDYSKRSDKEYFALPTNFDYCLTCREHHPHRVAHSVKADQEESIDSYRVFLANDYKDIPGGKGEITRLFQHYNNLYISTPHTTYRQVVSPGEIQTTVTTAFLGTGLPLAQPAQEVITADNGYMGGISRFAVINTPLGTFIPDEVQGRIFMLTDRPEEISNKGLRNWFEENLPIYYTTLLAGTTYPKDAFVRNLGLKTAYDDRHKRIILTKRDLRFAPGITRLPLASIDSNTPNGVLTFNGIVPYETTPRGLEEVELDDPRYFRNLSWTVSYSLLDEVWMGWHSYLPNFIYQNSNTFFTWRHGLTPNYVWKHNYGAYQTFYGTKYDHIIDTVFPTPATENLYHVEFISNSHLYDSTAEFFTLQPYTTFDRVLVYNNTQSSNITPLIMTNTNPFAGINPGVGNAVITRIREQYQINQLWDLALVKTVPLWTKDWTSTQNSYYIDKVPNSAAFTASTYYDLMRLKDTWVGVRLYANPAQDVKIVTDGIGILTAPNYR